MNYNGSLHLCLRLCAHVIVFVWVCVNVCMMHGFVCVCVRMCGHMCVMPVCTLLYVLSIQVALINKNGPDQHKWPWIIQVTLINTNALDQYKWPWSTQLALINTNGPDQNKWPWSIWIPKGWVDLPCMRSMAPAVSAYSWSCSRKIMVWRENVELTDINLLILNYWY